MKTKMMMMMMMMMMMIIRSFIAEKCLMTSILGCTILILSTACKKVSTLPLVNFYRLAIFEFSYQLLYIK